VTAGQTSSFELLEKVQPGGCLFYDVVNMGGPSKGRRWKKIGVGFLRGVVKRKLDIL